MGFAKILLNQILWFLCFNEDSFNASFRSSWFVYLKISIYSDSNLDAEEIAAEHSAIHDVRDRALYGISHWGMGYHRALQHEGAHFFFYFLFKIYPTILKGLWISLKTFHILTDCRSTYRNFDCFLLLLILISITLKQCVILFVWFLKLRKVFNGIFSSAHWGRAQRRCSLCWTGMTCSPHSTPSTTQIPSSRCENHFHISENWHCKYLKRK